MGTLRCCDFEPTFSTFVTGNLPLTLLSQVVLGMFAYLSQRLRSCSLDELTLLIAHICYS
jgi:hypothetical protein